MSVRVGLMGFGRIGRNIFRAIHGREDIEIVVINELADIDSMEYLLRFDSLRGSFEEPRPDLKASPLPPALSDSHI